MNWFLENSDKIISTCMTIISVIGFILALFARSKNAKIAKISSNLLSLTNKAKEAVETAEKFSNFTGSEKKQWATILIKEYCIANKIKYTDEEISEAIEKMVEVSKLVNKRY